MSDTLNTQWSSPPPVPAQPWPKQDPESMNAYYGNPDVNGDGQPDVAWEAANLVTIIPPYPMQWSWGPVCKSIRVHKKVADAMRWCLNEIGNQFNPTQRSLYHLDQIGGAYNFRAMRGSNSRLSIHSWGAAIDLAPLRNPLGARYNPSKGMMPALAVRIFEAAGIVWGGDWNNNHRTDDQTVLDSMHFQATQPVR